MYTLLLGVVGSTAYGLATKDSDVDQIGVFAAPTRDFHGLTRPAESHVTHDPDVTMHEAGKYARLALNGNPTVSELMWLDDYAQTTPLGLRLVAIRDAFLSADAVRNAYIGYARQQLAKLIIRGDGSFAADLPKKRAAKHARHLVRLVIQGQQLYTTGELTVRLDDPDHVRHLAELILANPEVGQAFIANAETAMLAAGTPLPDKPNLAAVNGWLHAVRDAYYTSPEER